MFFGDYGAVAQGADWNAKGIESLATDDSLFESDTYSPDQVGSGRRDHRNFGGVEDNTGNGIGWKGCQRSKAAGTYPGVVIRNLDAPTDGTKNNDGKRLAQRFLVPTPGGGVLTATLEQIRVRLGITGAPAGTTIAIYADALGLPSGAALGSFAVATTDIRDGWVWIDTAVVGLTVGAFYWIVLDTTGTAANNWTWGYVNTSTGTEFAAEKSGVPWVAQTYRLHYSTVFSWTASPKGEFLHVAFGADRKINTVRIYAYPSTRTVKKQGPQTVTLRRRTAPNVYADVTVTELRACDYAEETSAASIAGAQVSSATATFWEARFGEVTTDGFEIQIAKAQTDFDLSRIVAVEFYLAEDITERVNGYDVSIRRDTFLVTDQARDLTMGCSNVDRFFSPRYAPSSPQLADGFRNPELRPELEVKIEAGFSTTELVPLGTFFLDAIGIRPKERVANLRGRDFGKRFETTTLSEATQQSSRIEDLIELCANRANWSSSRYFPAQTENIVPFFFPAGTTVREEIDKLAEAAPFGTVRFDERGDLRFLTYLPSTSTRDFTVQGQSYYLGIGPPDRCHALPTGEKVYLSSHETQPGPDDVALIEYDIPTRTYRQLYAVTEVDATSFGQFATDGTFLFWTYGNFAYRMDLSSLAVISLDVSALVAGFTGVGFSNSWGQVVSGRYYFVVSDAANTILCSVTTALAGFTNHGNVAPTTNAVGRIVRWTPTGAIDRLYWTVEAGAHTQTHWDLVGAAFGNDGVTRRGVATDGTLLYELTSGNVLQSRTSAAVLSTIDAAVPAPGTNQNGTGIGFAAGRIWMSRRDATRTDLLRVYNLVDLSRFDIQIPGPFQRSSVLEDRTTGRLILVSDSSEATASVPAIRVVQGPNAPTASVLTASYDGELLAADYELTGENGGQSAIISGVRWVFNPVVLGSATTVWRMTRNGQQLSSTNLLTVPANTPAINLNQTGVGGPYFKPIPAKPYGNVSTHADIVGFICPTAAGDVTFGPAISRSLPPGEPSTTTPQQLVWTGSGGQISAVLSPHPTAPGIVLANASGTDNNLSMLEIRALVFVRLGMQVVEVLADEVLTDGASIVQRFGENVLEIQNDYISDTALLKLAAFELVRLYGRPQDQVRSVQLRPTWPLQLEDVIVVVEPESGINFRFAVVGIGHSRAVGTAHTNATLLMLPVASTAGLGQNPNPSPSYLGPVPA
jgi:hypothetical protein